MIVYHQNNVAAFKGNHVFYTLRPFNYASWRISVTSAAPTFSPYWAKFSTVVTGPAGMGPTNHA